jgi:hypothetical protein
VKVTKKKCEYSSDIFAWFGQLKATQVTFHISVTILSLSHKDMSPLLGRRKLETLSMACSRMTFSMMLVHIFRARLT